MNKSFTKRGLLLIILTFVFSFTAINSQYVLACTMAPPGIQIIDDGNKCYVHPESYYRRLNFTEIDISNIDQVCPEFYFSENDKQIILEFLDKLKKNFRYTYIERQTDAEHSVFLDEMAKTNSDICSCAKIVLEGRDGGWTAYTDSFKESCSFSIACYQPPFFCPNSLDFAWVFAPLLIIVFVIIIAVVFFIRKK